MSSPFTIASLEHRTVLAAPAVEALVTDRAGTYVDATFGRGGHARAVLARLAPAGRLVAFDRDAAARAAAAAVDDARFTFVNAPFSQSRERLQA
ncbi:MAG: 16S rRNA (cytosine(1402)-N(4))-methyltransferase, partial [Pseudomonadota bacterium]